MKHVKHGFRVALLTTFVFAIMLLTLPTVLASDVLDSFSINELNQPDITPAMLTKYRKNAITNINQLLHQADDPSSGSPYASVILVEFVDFKCPLSEKMDSSIQTLVAHNPSFRVIYKIISTRGDISTYAGKAALAANRQGKYLEFHKALMQAGKTLTQEKIMTLAKSLGLNINKLKLDMNSPEINDQLQTNLKLFHTLGLIGTPDLFFTKYNITAKANSNDIIVMLGFFNRQQLQNIINLLFL